MTPTAICGLILLGFIVGFFFGTRMEEVRRAAEASQKPHHGDTIFGKIANGEIPTKFIYEDNQCVAFHDINPQAPVHALIIPRKPIPQLSKSDDADEQLLGHMLVTARKVAKLLNVDSTGYRLVINDGRHGCQSVYHVHIHLLAAEANLRDLQEAIPKNLTDKIRKLTSHST